MTVSNQNTGTYMGYNTTALNFAGSLTVDGIGETRFQSEIGNQVTQITNNSTGLAIFSAIDTFTGNWTIVDASTFTVTGWTDLGGDKWSFVQGSSTYVFDEATGIVTAVPEPAAWGLMGVGLLTLTAVWRRRRI